MTQLSLEQQKEQAEQVYFKAREVEPSLAFSQEPTMNLCVINLGFGGENAASLDQIQSIIAPIMGSQRVIGNKNWPYLYVIYSHVELAINAFEELNNQVFEALPERVIFARYVVEPQNAFD